MQIEAAKIANKDYPNLERAVLVKAFMNGFKTQANSGLSYTPMGLYGDE